MYQLRLEISDNRLRSALEAHRDTILACPWSRVMAMEPDELRDIVARLVATMLADELSWLDERRLACNVRITDDEHVFIIDFAARRDALLFQKTWGGEFCDAPAAAVTH
jgi:hypothetical protein